MKRLILALCAAALHLSAPAANPSAPAQASPTATKAYVDRQIAAATNGLPRSAAEIGALPRSGGTLTGPLTINGDLTVPSSSGRVVDFFSNLFTIENTAYVCLYKGYEIATKDELADLATIAALAGKADASTVAALGADVAAWTTYWDGDDVRLTVTNYYGSLDMPRLYLEQKIEGTDNYRVVWDELTRQTNLSARIDAIAADLVLDSIPLRAWGHFDSHTGNAAPDGFASVSASNIIIAAGMAYQKFITSSGAAWVLTANEPFTLTGNADTDAGGFKITDGDGSALFEIVKGDKRTVGANAAGITVNGNTITIPFAVAAGTHPALQISRSLRPSEWVDESDASSFCTVTWSGGSGNWVATVTARQPEPQMFFRATYEIGGETYIKNNVSHSADKLTINGVQYRVAVETLTINGQQKKVMVLNEL